MSSDSIAKIDPLPLSTSVSESVQHYKRKLEEQILTISIVKALGLVTAHNPNNHPDAYCIIKVGSRGEARTKIQKKKIDPEWKERFEIKVPTFAHYVRVEIWDAGELSRGDSLGRVMIALSHLTSKKTAKWYEIQRSTSAFNVTGLIYLELSVNFPRKNPYGMTAKDIDKELADACSSMSSNRIKNINIESGDKIIELPGEHEEVEMKIPDVICVMSSQHETGSLYITNYRVVFISNRGRLENTMYRSNRNTFVSNLHTPRSRHVTATTTTIATTPVTSIFASSPKPNPTIITITRDFDNENSIDESADIDHSWDRDDESEFASDEDYSDDDEEMGSMLLDNPSIQTDISMTIPLGMLMSIEKSDGEPIIKRQSDLLIFKCRDFRVVQFFFVSQSPVFSIYKRIRYHTKAGPEKLTKDYVMDSKVRLNCWDHFSMEREFARQGLPMDSWSKSDLNKNYSLCDTYPSVLYFPKQYRSQSKDVIITPEIIQKSASFRSKKRLPALSWYNSRHNNFIIRSSQPMHGISNKSSPEDEKLIESFRKNTTKSSMFMIIDCRSKLAARGNRLKGQGTEDMTRYRRCRRLHMNIGNTHAMRKSLDGIRQMVEILVSEQQWFHQLHISGWLQHLRSVLSAATTVAQTIEEKKSSILVHCSDGWDRTSQITSLAQCFLDSYYRTFDGFRTLIEKEWLAFGHKFRERFGNDPTKPRERSPIFIQFLDCVYQVMLQFPKHFQFNVEYLTRIATHCNSGWFGTFMYDCERKRKESAIKTSTISIWAHLNAHRKELINPSYVLSNNVILPITSVKSFTLWTEFYLRYDEIYYRRKRKWFKSPMFSVVHQMGYSVEEKDEEVQLHVPHLGAYLWKLGDKVKNWKCRWFVLENGSLTYWKTDNRTKEFGKINVDHADVFIYGLGAFEQRNGSVFGIKPAKTQRTYVLEAPNETERTIWVRALLKSGAIDKGEQRASLVPIITTSKSAPISKSAPTTPPKGHTPPNLPILGPSLSTGNSPRGSMNETGTGQIDISNNIGVVWVPDEWSEECFECTSKFTLVRRRHHCRSCGRLFCQKCLSKKMVIPHANTEKVEKVCDSCYSVGNHPS